LVLAFLSLSASAILLPPVAARTPILLAIVVWGVSAWSFFPAQQARLINIAGVKVAPVALSLNASFQFLGFSAGAALGSLTLTNASPLALGWVGASCVVAALSLVLAASRRARSSSPVTP
jgi:predicted MFS family arabinose efflux permease